MAFGGMFGAFGPNPSDGNLGQPGVVQGQAPSSMRPGGFPGIYPGMGPGQSGMAGFNEWINCVRRGIPPSQCPPRPVGPAPGQAMTRVIQPPGAQI